jgi:N utilization substance protein A
MKGSRVQAVVQELRGEKIDIIPWTRDIAKNVCNALAPAEVSRMIIDDEQEMVLVIVSDDQLSLAIGKKGQNVRLASQLTDWKIDIKGETEMEDLTKQAQTTLGRIPGIGPVLAEKLYLEGFTSAYDLSHADSEVLAAIPGIGKVKAGRIMEAASDYFQDQLEAGEVDVRGQSIVDEEERKAADKEGAVESEEEGDGGPQLKESDAVEDEKLEPEQLSEDSTDGEQTVEGPAQVQTGESDDAEKESAGTNPGAGKNGESE